MDHHDAVPEGGPAGMVYDPDRDIVLGHEFVGEVVAHGPDCTDQFPVGTKVTAMPILLIDGGLGGTKVIGQHPEAQGSFGELLVVPELMARVVPDVTGLDKQFDYLVPESLRSLVAVGSMVRAPLHGRRVGGWVTLGRT